MAELLDPSHQATLWVVRLDRGALSETERKQLRQWLCENAENRIALQRARAIWQLFDNLAAEISEGREIVCTEMEALINAEI
ncbi:FecR/PupR family sigma factor regulator [Sedimenticola sp.]|uniref:FecR/PupR family sigma factor regulator n=1 Tax=Sedimenticola sp. TaxID=1940285 RepID=UPI003D0F0EDA